MGLSDVRLPTGTLANEEEKLVAVFRSLPHSKRESLFAFLAGLTANGEKF